MSINEEQKEIEELDEAQEQEEKETIKVNEEKCEDCKECKTKKGSMGLVTVLIIVLIVVSAIGGWIVGTSRMVNILEEKNNKVSQKNQEVKENAKDETTEVEEVEQNDKLEKAEETTKSNISSSNAPRCTGTYYGKYYSKDNQGITTNMEYTYVLNEDGTYTANLSNIHELKGAFIITENTATFIQLKDTYGDPKESTIYTSVDYVMSDDCSYMLVDDGKNFKLDRQ